MDTFVLGINGSPHKEGVGARLLGQVLAWAEREGAETSLVHLVDFSLGFPDGEYHQETPPGLERLFELLLRADGVVFSTPVYWFNVSGLMKTLLDHMTNLEIRNFALEGKVAGLIATCEEDGGQSALSAMAAPLVHMGFILPPYAMVFQSVKTKAGSEQGWQEKDFALLGTNVVRLAKMLRGQAWGYESMAN